MSNNSDSGGGIGFLGALGLLFIGLKLGNVIDWSWYWVLLPLYGPLTLLVAIIFVYLIYSTVADLLNCFFGDK